VVAAQERRAVRQVHALVGDPAIHNGGTMVNGVHALPSAFVLEKTDGPY